MFIVSVLTVTTLMMLVRPPQWLADVMEIEAFSYDRVDENLFRITLLALPMIHLVLSVLIEVSYNI